MKTFNAAVPAIAVAFALTAFACTSAPTGKDTTPAPDFTLTDLQGKTLSLAASKGKVLVLNFWATWCPPCRREIPDFVEAYRELRDLGLEIIGVSVDETTAESLLEWTKKTGINYPIALATPEIERAYGPITSIPTTFVIDRAGRIRHSQSGLMDKATLLRLFRESR